VQRAVVHGAQVQDRDGAKQVLAACGDRPRLRRIWADGGYQGALEDWVLQHCGMILEIVKRNADVKGFEVLPHRWVVERTLGWLGRFRRLSKDYEYLPKTSETMIYVAMICVMVCRLL
jgi:putative transposase